MFKCHFLLCKGQNNQPFPLSSFFETIRISNNKCKDILSNGVNQKGNIFQTLTYIIVACPKAAVRNFHNSFIAHYNIRDVYLIITCEWHQINIVKNSQTKLLINILDTFQCHLTCTPLVFLLNKMNVVISLLYLIFSDYKCLFQVEQFSSLVRKRLINHVHPQSFISCAIL